MALPTMQALANPINRTMSPAMQASWNSFTTAPTSSVARPVSAYMPGTGMSTSYANNSAQTYAQQLARQNPVTAVNNGGRSVSGSALTQQMNAGISRGLVNQAGATMGTYDPLRHTFASANGVQAVGGGQLVPTSSLQQPTAPNTANTNIPGRALQPVAPNVSGGGSMGGMLNSAMSAFKPGASTAGMMSALGNTTGLGGLTSGAMGQIGSSLSGMMNSIGKL